MAPSYGARRRVGGIQSRRAILLLSVVSFIVVSLMTLQIYHLTHIDPSTSKSTPLANLPKPPPLVALGHPTRVAAKDVGHEDPPTDEVAPGADSEDIDALLHSLGKCSTTGGGGGDGTDTVTDLWQSPQTVANMRRKLADHLRVTKQQSVAVDAHVSGSVPLVFPPRSSAGGAPGRDYVAVPVHDMSRSSMQIDIQLFVVWPAAMGVLSRILEDISKTFLVVKVAHFAWEPDVGPARGTTSAVSPSDPVTEQERFYLEHLWRLYSRKGGLSRSEMLTKVYQVGGPHKNGFVAIVVMDPGAAGSGKVEYSEMPTAHGKDHVSRAMFEKKKLYRKWAMSAHVSEDAGHTKLLEQIGNGKIPKGNHAVGRVSNNFRVHGTYTSLESEHDIRVLFGVTPLDMALAALLPTGTPCPTYYPGNTASDFIAYMGNNANNNKHSRFMTIRGITDSDIINRADEGEAWVTPLGVVDPMASIYSPRASTDAALSVPSSVVQWPNERSMMFALAASVAAVEGGTTSVRCDDGPVCSPQPPTHPDQLSVYLGGGVDPRLNSDVGPRSFKVDQGVNSECLSNSKLFNWRRFDQQYLRSNVDTSCIQSVEASGGNRFSFLRITISNHFSLKSTDRGSVTDSARLAAMWNIAAVLYGSPVRGSQGRCDAAPTDAVNLESLHDFLSSGIDSSNGGTSTLIVNTSKGLKEQQHKFSELLGSIHRMEEGVPSACASMWFLAYIAKAPLVIEIQITL